MAREALNLILAYGFDYLNLNNIMLKVFAFNEVAINCYKKVGFKEIGRRRQSYYKKGEFFDEIYMDIFKRRIYGVNYTLYNKSIRYTWLCIPMLWLI